MSTVLSRKLRTVFTNRLLRFLTERAQKEPDSYAHFYKDYGIFLKEGIIIENEQLHKVFFIETHRIQRKVESPKIIFTFHIRKKFQNFFALNLQIYPLGNSQVCQII